MTPLALTLNGQTTHLEVESTTLLVEALRGPAGLTGTHTGCDTSQCGACTVLLDGEAIKSCTMLALQAEGRSVTTIEGLATGSKMHPIQAAFIDKHGLQCGFCTPGMIMTASCLLTKTPHPSDEQIVEALEGNLCRCTGYVNIVAAVRAAAELMATDNAAVQS
jgi:carbon-monoxide dehydrogenase small subunit